MATQIRTPEQRRAEYLRNREKHRARSRAWYLKNREKVRAYNVVYCRENMEKVSSRKAEYRALKREELAAKQLARYYANRPKNLKKFAVYRQLKRDKLRADSRKRSVVLSDSYVREQLSKNKPISSSAWPKSLVEIKRIQMQINRELKKYGKAQKH